MKPEIHIGGIYLCKDGRIRKVTDIKKQQRWSWEKRVYVEIVRGKAAKMRSRLTMTTMEQYAIAEVPEEYHNKLDIYPAVYALRQTLVEIDVSDEPNDVLVYKALLHAKAAGLKAEVVAGIIRPRTMIELPTGAVEFEMEPHKRWDRPNSIEQQQRIDAFLRGEKV